MKSKPRFFKHLILTASAALLTEASANAALLYSGSASITLSEGVANGIQEFDALFSESTTRANTLALAAPGNAPFTEGATVQLVDAMRPSGATLITGDGRARQATTLDFDPGNILGSWSTSSDSFGFTGSSTLGEQIGFTLMQRWTGPFPGALLYGDFALRYTGSKLMLTSNIDFLNAEFAEIGSPVVNFSGNTLSISGDLLIGEGLALLDGSAIPGTDFGDFSFTGSIAPVPEPATTAFGIAALAAATTRRRRAKTNA